MRRGLVLAAVCLGWGTIPLIAAETELPAVLIVFARVWIAAAGLAVAIAALRPSGPPPFSVAPARCALTGVVLAAHWTAMFAAYDRAPADAVIFLIFLAPVGIAVIERPGARLVAALAVALAGFVLVAGPSFTSSSRRVGDGLALAGLAGVLFVALVLLSKPLAATYGGVRLAFIEMVVAGVVLTPVAVTSEWTDVGRALPWLAVLGLVHSAFGTVMYFQTLALVPATEVGILGYLEPVGVVLFAWLFAGDAPSATTLVGGALVVAGGSLAISTRTEVPVRVSR